jgi:adrenodoxin-NADP+ reductase
MVREPRPPARAPAHQRRRAPPHPPPAPPPPHHYPGLVRTGVAPDHPEVKQVTNDFEEVAKDARFGFLGNVTVGAQVQVAELLSLYDGVVLAYGAASDRAMGVPGEGLAGVHAARAFVNWYNGHPDFRDFAPNLDTEDVVIVGQGNVAIDCARILCKTRAELAETDIAAHALDALSRSRVKRVHVVGRRGHVQAAVTMKELREATRLADADFCVREGELAAGRTPASLAEMEAARARKRMDALLAEAAAAGAARGAAAKKGKALEFRFLRSPLECLPAPGGGGAVGAVRLAVNRLEGAAEAQRAVATGKTELLPAGLVLKSIGYKSLPLPGVPFDARAATVLHAAGRVLAAPGGAPVKGLYCAGWAKRGPTGIVGTNIGDARETVASLLADFGGSGGAGGGKGGLPALRALLASRGAAAGSLVAWSGWRKIDEGELARGAAAGKCREKFTDVPSMLAVGGGV